MAEPYARRPDRRFVPERGFGVARRRFGGLDVPASLVGMLAAVGFVVILATLFGAVGAVGYQTGLNAAGEDIAIGGYVLGLAVLFLAFVVGGWAAGRIARFDGVLNGGMVVLWFVLLAAVFGGLGAWIGEEYNVFRDVNLPTWFTDNATTTSAIVTGALAFIVMVGGALLGGWLGEKYHREVDSVIADSELTEAQPLESRDVYERDIAEVPPVDERDVPPEERRRVA